MFACNFRVDDLFRFIHAWVPSLYGELDEDYWRERGYILSDTDINLSPELTPNDPSEASDSNENGKGVREEMSELTRESWEVSLSFTIFIRIFFFFFILLKPRL